MKEERFSFLSPLCPQYTHTPCQCLHFCNINLVFIPEFWLWYSVFTASSTTLTHVLAYLTFLYCITCFLVQSFHLLSFLFTHYYTPSVWIASCVQTHRVLPVSASRGTALCPAPVCMGILCRPGRTGSCSLLLCCIASLWLLFPLSSSSFCLSLWWSTF